MRLALNFEAPDIERAIRRACPAIEIVKPTQATRGCAADALLTPLQGEVALADLLSQCHGLRWVHVLGTGVDSFPLELAGQRTITCSRGATAIPIAEWVLAMLLNFEKRLPSSWVTSPPDQWFQADLGSLEGKTLGLVGLGTIGQEVAKRALAFNMRVMANVRRHRASSMRGVELVEDLDTILHVADHLVLALPATPDSHQLLNAANLSKTKRGSHLVNVARASLIDQDALRGLLDSGHIAAASLDVVEPEPLPVGHWLYEHPRVRLSPHVSWCAPGIVDRMLAIFLRNLDAFAAGQPLNGVVNVSAGY